MTEQKISQEVNTPSKIDARDFFQWTLFQKEAQAIDPDPSHEWEIARDYDRLVRDEEGQVAVAQTYDPEAENSENRWGLLIAERDANGEASSAYIQHELAPETRNQILDFVGDISPRLKGNTRHKAVRTVIELIPSLTQSAPEDVSEVLTTLIFKLIPDQGPGSSKFDETLLKEASPQQHEQLLRLLTLASSKLPSELFSQKLSQMLENLRWIDQPFGRNYNIVLSDIRRLVLENREDTEVNYDSLERSTPATYSIADKITRTFSNKDEVEKILTEMPVEIYPDVRFFPRSRERAEMVSLDAVVGGTSINNWSLINASEGRGLENVFKLTQALQEGSTSVIGSNNPIRVDEINGKYFVSADGRHRTAALKALGVKEVPMLVTHVKMAQ